MKKKEEGEEEEEQQCFLMAISFGLYFLCLKK